MARDQAIIEVSVDGHTTEKGFIFLFYEIGITV